VRPIRLPPPPRQILRKVLEPLHLGLDLAPLGWRLPLDFAGETTDPARGGVLATYLSSLRIASGDQKRRDGDDEARDSD
jgi:hypothetical protein